MALARVRDAAVGAWFSLQVELHGSYSLARLAALKRYKLSTPRRWGLVPILLTPAPCVLFIILVDLPHLSNPHDGLAGSHVFWTRAWLSVMLIAFMLMQQMRCLIPDLQMTQRQIAVVSCTVGSCSIAFGISLSRVVGFPLPFTFASGSPMFMVSLTSSVLVLWGRRFYESRALRRQLGQYLMIVVVQWTLTLIYPLFNFVFVRLSSIAQTVFALVLPIIKILMKYWLAKLMENLQDLQPEFVIFNVEVFHALFVACCMQNAASGVTTAALMVMDALHAWLSIHDVSSQLNGLSETLGISKEEASTLNAFPPLVDSTVYLLRDRKTYDAVAATRSHRSSHRRLSSIAKRTAIVPLESVQRGSPTSVIPTSQQPPVQPPKPRLNTTATAPTIADMALSKLPVALSESEMRHLDSLSSEQKETFIRQVLALLHMTEFLLLIEYVEVIVPIIYSLYLGVVFHLPNRVYYPQLKAMTDSSLRRIVQNELIYAALEFLSFFVLDWMLRRKIRFDPVRQLTFVLGTEWHIVQAKLILWLMYMVQASLVHFGADYTFKFEWLHNSTFFDE